MSSREDDSRTTGALDSTRNSVDLTAGSLDLTLDRFDLTFHRLARVFCERRSLLVLVSTRGTEPDVCDRRASSDTAWCGLVPVTTRRGTEPDVCDRRTCVALTASRRFPSAYAIPLKTISRIIYGKSTQTQRNNKEEMWQFCTSIVEGKRSRSLLSHGHQIFFAQYRKLLELDIA